MAWENEKNSNVQLTTVDIPPANVPSKRVFVVTGTAPLEQSVVSQAAFRGKQVGCSIQWSGCQTDGKKPGLHLIGGWACGSRRLVFPLYNPL